MTDPTRRAVLAAAPAIGALAVLPAAAAEPKSLDAAVARPAKGKAATKTKLDKATIAAAEKLALVEYSDPKRGQVLATIDTQLDRIRALRAVHLENDDAPALTFDPRLPGRVFAEQQNRIAYAPRPALPLPADEADIAFAPLLQLSAWLAGGAIDSERLTRLYLARIERFAPRLSCFVTVTAELALEQARRTDRERAAGKQVGPLHGVPYVLKDLADTAGIRTSWGAVAFQDRVAKRDATVVSRLQDAGAVLLGKTTMGELAYGDIWFGGVTRNPWNLEEGSSGSSAGSASAVAAGLAGFGIGTETLGSIVSPSHRCGTVGLRPTFGRVPRTGCMALCWSLDKIGPLVRSSEDAVPVLAALNGADAGDPCSRDHGFAYDGTADVSGMRVAYDPAWFADKDATDPDRAALAAMRGLGVTMVERSLPDLPYATLLTQLEAEAAAAFSELTLSGDDQRMRWQADAAWPNTWRRARFLTAVDLVQTDRFRRRVMHEAERFFDGVDAVIGPNFAGSMLLVTNFTGHPCLTVRAGFRELATRPSAFDRPGSATAAKHRVPHNVSLWAGLYREGTLLALGRALEQRLDVQAIRPDLT